MKINDLEFNVQIRGAVSEHEVNEEDSKNSDHKVFIWGHGLSGSIEAENILDWYRWHDFPPSVTLIRYDARGHGKSQLSNKPEDYHWRNLGRDMLAIAETAGAGQFVAGGSSMGCATTIYAALQVPERVKAMVLVIPPTSWETRAAQGATWDRFALFGRLLGGKGMARMMAQNMDRMLPVWLIEAEPEKMAGVAKGLTSQKRRALWNIFKGAGLTDLPPRDAFIAIEHIPSLILAWVDDPVHPISTAQELHRLLPQSELFIAQGYEDFKTVPERMADFVLRHA